MPPHPAVCHAGLVSVRKNVGGGSFLAGYKRHYADMSSLEASWLSSRPFAGRQLCTLFVFCVCLHVRRAAEA